MHDPFEKLKAITDVVYSGNPPPNFHEKIVNLLAEYGIKIRQDDGSDPKITISHPTSLPGGMVIGLRYVKKDGTKSEDLFVFQHGQSIKAFYKGSLEKLFPEYKGSHKLNR
jgi:hypothetical protein